MNEIWKTAVGFEQYYEVSRYGRIRTITRVTTSIREGIINVQKRPSKILSPFLNHSGYPTVALKVGKIRRKYLVHRIIAMTFVDGYADDLTVNHINGNKSDNNISNLEWVTLSENTRLQWETGLINLRGENHPSVLLMDEDVKYIKKHSEFSASLLAEKFGVSASLIYKIRQGKKRNR